MPGPVQIHCKLAELECGSRGSFEKFESSATLSGTNSEQESFGQPCWETQTPKGHFLMPGRHSRSQPGLGGPRTHLVAWVRKKGGANVTPEGATEIEAMCLGMSWNWTYCRHP